jgi:hypothetical protein
VKLSKHPVFNPARLPNTKARFASIAVMLSIFKSDPIAHDERAKAPKVPADRTMILKSIFSQMPFNAEKPAPRQFTSHSLACQLVSPSSFSSEPLSKQEILAALALINETERMILRKDAPALIRRMQILEAAGLFSDSDHPKILNAFLDAQKEGLLPDKTCLLRNLFALQLFYQIRSGLSGLILENPGIARDIFDNFSMQTQLELLEELEEAGVKSEGLFLSIITTLPENLNGAYRARKIFEEFFPPGEKRE